MHGSNGNNMYDEIHVLVCVYVGVCVYMWVCICLTMHTDLIIPMYTVCYR